LYKKYLRSPLCWWGGGSQPPFQELHLTSALQASAHQLPSPGKNPAGAHESGI